MKHLYLAAALSLAALPAWAQSSTDKIDYDAIVVPKIAMPNKITIQGSGGAIMTIDLEKRNIFVAPDSDVNATAKAVIDAMQQYVGGHCQ